MAGGQLTPRQKMVNLMYLVFIAMLALNMSKEVLSAFGILNEKLESSNKTADVRNSDLLTQLGEKAIEQPKTYASLKRKADEVKKLSLDFNTYIEKLKLEFLKDAAKNDDGKYAYEALDKGDNVDEYWFKGDKLSAKGEEFMKKFNDYALGVNRTLGTDLPDIQKEVLARFNTKDVKANDGATKKYLEYHYQGFPLIATVTKLSQLQADIKTTESDVMSAMFQGSLKRAASLSAFEAIVVPTKSTFFSGEAVTGKIILGKKDPNLKAHRVVVNGQTLPESAMQTGQTLFSFGAGAVGEHEITGLFEFKEGDSIVPIKIAGNYVVVPKPNSATISADKMNVVYRGVKNPMTISFAGISDNNVVAAAPGLSKAGQTGKYNMECTTLKGREVTINVSGKLPDGTSVSDKKMFRVKDIPSPQGSIRGETGTIKGPKSSLEASTIGAVLEDFDFELGLSVSGFNIKIPGQPTIVVNGNKLDTRAKSALARAGRGDQITISEIKASLVGGTGYKLKKTSPVIYEISN